MFVYYIILQHDISYLFFLKKKWIASKLLVVFLLLLETIVEIQGAPVSTNTGIAWYIHWLIIPTLLFTIMINISNVDVIKCAFHQVLRLPNSLLRLFYLSLQQLQYCYLNCVYPNLPCQLSLWKLGNQSTRRKPTTFGRALTRSENRTHELRRERQRSPVHYELYFRWL